jgi:hypothetical protein
MLRRTQQQSKPLQHYFLRSKRQTQPFAVQLGSYIVGQDQNHNDENDSYTGTLAKRMTHCAAAPELALPAIPQSECDVLEEEALKEVLKETFETSAAISAW